MRKNDALSGHLVAVCCHRWSKCPVCHCYSRGLACCRTDPMCTFAEHVRYVHVSLCRYLCVHACKGRLL